MDKQIRITDVSQPGCVTEYEVCINLSFIKPNRDESVNSALRHELNYMLDTLIGKTEEEKK